MDNRTRKNILVAIILIVIITAGWWIGKLLIERSFPADVEGKIPWSDRGQFGDMFGAITSLMTALNLTLLVYAFLLQVSESRRQSEISKWQANYTYLLDAKKLITDHPEVLELHGLPADLPKVLGVTAAQVAYVVIDLKAADLYYKIDGSNPVKMTDYRRKMLENEKYRAIAKKCIIDGTLLPESPFTNALRAELSTNNTQSVNTDKETT